MSTLAEGRAEHARNAVQFLLPGECVIRPRDWPYPCQAKDENPTDVVEGCLTHDTWWHGPAEDVRTSVRTALRRTDGTLASVVSLVTGLTLTDLDDLGGVPSR